MPIGVAEEAIRPLKALEKASYFMKQDRIVGGCYHRTYRLTDMSL